MNKLNLPNIWGHGAIFAYSGLEGECHCKESLVGTLGEDGISIKFRNGDNVFLYVGIDNLVNLFYDAVLSDTVSAEVLYKNGEKHGFDMLFVSQNVIVVRGSGVTAKLVYIDDVNAETNENITVYTGKKIGLHCHREQRTALQRVCCHSEIMRRRSSTADLTPILKR